MIHIEYICEQEFVDLFKRYSKVALKEGINLNQSTAKAFPGMASQEKSENRAATLLGKLNGLNLSTKAKAIEDSLKGNEELYRYICNQCNTEAGKMAKVKPGGKNSITKGITNAVKTVMSNLNSLMNTNKDAQSFLNIDYNTDVTKGKKTIQTFSEGMKFTECVNPLYVEEGEYNLNNLDPASQTLVNTVKSKPVKATLLTLVTFIVTLLLTNVIRIYLGGSPGGDFGTPWQRGLFTFFTSLFLAPIIEEPAKMIAIRGGYGKHFFFAFNFLEFGGYILMFLASGSQGLGIFIVLRAICVIFHAISMIMMKGGSRGPVSTALKVAFCVLLHFAFNALFLKYAGALAGLGTGKLLMFAMGFFGVAFGVFKLAKLGAGLVKRGVNAMTGRRG